MLSYKKYKISLKNVKLLIESSMFQSDSILQWDFVHGTLDTDVKVQSIYV